MFWVIALFVLAFVLFLLYQVESAALKSAKADMEVVLAEFSKHTLDPAKTVLSKEFSAAIAALKKHL